MARRSKRLREKRPTEATTNRHHILYQNRYWKKGIAKKLRNDPIFIVHIDIDVHDRIHREVLTIPVPSCKGLKTLYERLQNERYWLDIMNPLGRIQWLINAIPNETDTCMALQRCRDILCEEITPKVMQGDKAIAAYAF